jgi:putative hydrolase of the HAD superfamily
VIINTDKYKHFSFDLWLTLIRSNPAFKSARNSLFREYFSIEKDLEEVGKTIRYFDLLCNNISEKTGIHINTYQIYYFILSALDVSIDNVNEQQLNEFYNESETLFMKYKPELIYPNINILFKRIRAEEKTMSILSNTAFIKGESLKKLLAYYELNDYFSFQLYSDEIGFSKPNIQLFNLVYEKVKPLQKINKQDIVHIGDNKIADCIGATKSGFNSILI